MKTVIIKTSILLLLLLTIVSCKKQNSVTPSKKLSYQFKVVTASVPLSASINNSRLQILSTATGGGEVTWQSGYANVSSISFDGQNQNNNNEEDDFNEPQVYKVDLFSSNQLLGNIDVAPGTYHNVEIKVELKRTLTDSALFLKGIYTTASGSIPVELSLDGNDNNLLEIPVTAQDLTVGSTNSYIAIINLHLDKLMAGVTSTDLDSATLINGSILINSSSNIAIYTKIKANIDNFSDDNYNNE